MPKIDPKPNGTSARQPEFKHITSEDSEERVRRAYSMFLRPLVEELINSDDAEE